MNDMSILIARGRATGNAELLEIPTTAGGAVQGGATAIEGNPYDSGAPQQETPVEPVIEQQLDEKPF